MCDKSLSTRNRIGLRMNRVARRPPGAARLVPLPAGWSTAGLFADTTGSGSGDEVDDAPLAGLSSGFDGALLRQPVRRRFVGSRGGMVQIDDKDASRGVVDENIRVVRHVRQARILTPAPFAGARRNEHARRGAALRRVPPVRD